MDLYFENRQEAISFVIESYKQFYEKNQDKGNFSERKFAQQINVSQSSLNSLRNEDKKEIDFEIIIKILRGIGREYAIGPISATLLPEYHNEVKYQDTLPQDRFIVDKNEYSELINLSVTHPYGLIISLVCAGPDVTVEEIKNISSQGEDLLQDLVKRDILQISNNAIVRLSKRIRKILKKIEVLHINDIEVGLRYIRFLTSISNSYKVKHDEQPGHIRVGLDTFHEKDLPEVIKIYDDADRKASTIARNRPGGTIRLGRSSMVVFLSDTDDCNQSKKNIKLEECNEDKEILQ